MALIKCKECGHEVSKKAKTCPSCGGPVGPKHYGCGTLLAIIIAVLAIFGAIGSFQESSKPKYVQSWTNDVNVEISRTLVANNVRGCGEYKYKQRSSGSSEYLVQCSADGKNWVEYLVFTGIGKVNGPFKPGQAP